jgi:chemotaxis protein MotB
MAAGNNAPIIIKKIKKGGGDGHHGGAWKVAYADFVTAMMAFFLLMWLINTTTPEQKRGIADYFAPEAVSRSSSGNGALLGGTSASEDGHDGQGTLAVKTLLRQPKVDSHPTNPTDETQNKADGKAGSDKSSNSEQTEQATARLRQAMQDMPDLAELSHHILIDDSPQGTRIQLVDQDGRSMFEAGSAEPTERVKVLLKEVAKIVGELPNRIAISGHTDGEAFSGPGGYSNWDLSAARANASLRILMENGVPDDRIAEVTGKAGSDPLYPDNPQASANRRISIVLLREAPVMPPDQ